MRLFQAISDLRLILPEFLPHHWANASSLPPNSEATTSWSMFGGLGDDNSELNSKSLRPHRSSPFTVPLLPKFQLSWVVPDNVRKPRLRLVVAIAIASYAALDL